MTSWINIPCKGIIPAVIDTGPGQEKKGNPGTGKSCEGVNFP
jgi:hypothetical protein